MRKMKCWAAASLVTLSFLTLSYSWSVNSQTSLAGRMLRLHVVANSDTQADQDLKLDVRDAVLERCGILLSEKRELSLARETLKSSLGDLARTGAAVVGEHGKSYPVRVKMEYAPFPPTDYGSFSLPAGRYQALRVEIGEAKGHNWWCVLFPSLCLAGETELSETAMAQGLTEEDVALMEQEEPEYVVRFRCLELWEELKTALEQKKQE